MKKQAVTMDDLLKILKRIEEKVDRADTKSSLNKEFLTTVEACQYLGCSRVMIWKMVNNGKITRLKLENGRTYYASAELKKLIETPLQDAA